MAVNNYNKDNNGDENFEPFTYGRTMSSIISKDMYTKPDVAIREMLSNISDQYLHEKAQDSLHYMKAYIELDPLHKTLRVIDYATGIEDVNLFKVIGFSKAGKTVGSRVSTTINPDEEMIGRWHIGKASFASLSSKETGLVVKFESNNGSEGHRLAMTKKPLEGGEFEFGWDKNYVSQYPAEHAGLARKEKAVGLSVQIEEVCEDFLSLTHVKNLVSKQFGLLMRFRGFQIYIRDVTKSTSEQWERINPPNDLDTKGVDKLQVPSTSGRAPYEITHCFNPIEKPSFENVDLYKNYVYITSIHRSYKVHGWFNDNKIGLVTGRDRPRIDDIYDRSIATVTEYLAKTFDKEGAARPAKIKGVKDLVDIMNRMLGVVQRLYEKEPLILAGILDESSEIRGHIQTDPSSAGSWKKETGKKLVHEGGTEEGGPVIPIGKKRRKKGRRRTGTGGNLPGIEEGGTHDVLIGNTSSEDRPETGPIKPAFSIDKKDIGIFKPLTYMETADRLILNTDQPAIYSIIEMQKISRESTLAPFMAEALAELVTRFRDTQTSIDQYRQMVSDIYTQGFLSPKA